VTRVGFIGLGNQGAPTARRIIDAGYPTTLYARRVATLEPFANSAAIAASPAELAAASDMVCVCVVDDAGVEDVLMAENGVLAGLQPGASLPSTALSTPTAAAVWPGWSLSKVAPWWTPP
jgi:3-hydroxyisobutyrate dehydrogenase